MESVLHFSVTIGFTSHSWRSVECDELRTECSLLIKLRLKNHLIIFMFFSTWSNYYMQSQSIGAMHSSSVKPLLEVNWSLWMKAKCTKFVEKYKQWWCCVMFMNVFHYLTQLCHLQGPPTHHFLTLKSTNGCCFLIKQTVAKCSSMAFKDLHCLKLYVPGSIDVIAWTSQNKHFPGKFEWVSKVRS